MSKFVVKDTFFKKAKREGYRARSAYKLKEMQAKYHLIKKADRVLDLGCAPGSFLQVISEIVGPEGLTIGIDILPLKPLPQKNIVVITFDIRMVNIKELCDKYALPHFDAITCDISPNLSGIKEVDNKNSEELYFAVRKVVTEGLKKGGNLLIKAFFSDIFKDVSTDIQTMFNKVSLFKPVASRSKSSEIYLVCSNKK